MLASNLQEIQAFERKVDFVAILQSGEPSLMMLKKEEPEKLFDFCALCATNYLSTCFPNQIGLAPVIASDLIETRPTWKALDLVNLFKFVRQRQDIAEISELSTQGNQMTVPKFMAMVAVYEAHRSEAMEQFHAKHKGDLAEENKSLEKLAPKILEKFTSKEKVVTQDFGMGKEFDRVQAERERTGEDVSYKKINHKDFFEPKK